MHLLLNKYSRVLYYNGSTYTDNSEEMRSWTYGTMLVPLTLNTDYIYISAPHTFAARFFNVSVINSVSARLKIEYYKGSSTWATFKNIRDETALAGKPFAQSGFVSWDLPTDWVKNQINSLPELPPTESSGDHHGDYWIRISSTATLTATTALKWLGLIWTHQNYMKVKWPEVDSSIYLPTGKSDWYELIEMSTGDVADDLNISNIIDYELQVKDIDELAKLTALKTMINILIPMSHSDTLSRMRADFEKEYTKLLGKRLKGIDTDGDEKIDSHESQPFSNSRIIRS